MPDLPTLSGGPSETGSFAAGVLGVLVSSSASANTKGSWAEVITSTDYASNWLLVTLNYIGFNDRNLLVDIGVGASTAEQVLISNLYTHTPSASSLGDRTFLFPLRIPAGTRIAARCQASTGSSTIGVGVTAISSAIGAPPGLTRVETIGANTADSTGVSIDCGAVTNTDVIGELVASTAFGYRWMCLSIGCPADASWSGTRAFLVDVVTGAGGSEVQVLVDLPVAGSSADSRPNPSVFCFPCAIGAGQRVAIRVQSDSNTAGERVLDYVGYGVG